MPKCQVILEIPLWIDYEYCPAEKSTNWYPGCSEHIHPNKVEIPDDLAEYVLETYAEEISEACIEDYHEGRGNKY